MITPIWSKTGAGTFTLGDGPWALGGDTTVSQRGLAIGKSGFFTTGVGTRKSNINGTSRVLLTAGVTVGVNVLSGSGSITNSGGSFDQIGVIIGNNDQTSSYGGQIQKGTAKNSYVIKVGTGTLTQN